MECLLEDPGIYLDELQHKLYNVLLYLPDFQPFAIPYVVWGALVRELGVLCKLKI